MFPLVLKNNEPTRQPPSCLHTPADRSRDLKVKGTIFNDETFWFFVPVFVINKTTFFRITV